MRSNSSTGTWESRTLIKKFARATSTLLLWIVVGCSSEQDDAKSDAASQLRQSRLANPRSVHSENKVVTLWWDAVPDSVRASGQTSDSSNIHPSDYAGAESCRVCHKKNYDSWAKHPHRWMNAMADDSTVKGDFDNATMSYMGGEISFRKVGDRFQMLLERDDISRQYDVTQTIGSRFYQYYVGKLVTGPEPKSHEAYSRDHVLPVGYWLSEKQWVPIVHVSSVRRSESPDTLRDDPFLAKSFSPYSDCNSCHTTFALGDVFGRDANLLSRHSSRELHWDLSGFVAEFHPDLLEEKAPVDLSNFRLDELSKSLVKMEAPDHAMSLGVSCEACHLGAKEHAERKLTRPDFYPRSPHLWVNDNDKPIETGRTHDNLNWACGRCHTGQRPQLAAGMATWNSTEFSDAMRGSCYSKLRCVDCHNPHEATGPKWTRPPAKDDASCIRCHEQFTSAEQIESHTHHPANTAGSRCMNCHMPKLNEGMQDVVRTHMIFSPTNKAMIESNQPNACNLCHVDKPIDWTTKHLAEWYKADFSTDAIAAATPDREQPTALNWLKSDNEAVRLISVDAMVRAGYKDAVPQMLEALDDPYLLNRQFATTGLESLLGVRLSDYGYRFYMMGSERAEPLHKLRAAMKSKLSESTDK